MPLRSSVGSKLHRRALSTALVPEQRVTGGLVLSSPPSTYCSVQAPALTLPMTSVRWVTSAPSAGPESATVGVEQVGGGDALVLPGLTVMVTSSVADSCTSVVVSGGRRRRPR